MPRDTTEVRVDEYGDEFHESWILLTQTRSQGGGARLFDSEVNHHRYVTVKVERCSRKRDLHTDWLHHRETLMEFAMSFAQWGQFVSSSGDGGGTPATLQFLVGEGLVPSAPFESRLEESHKEVRAAAAEATQRVQKSMENLQAVFDNSGGRRAMREALRDMSIAVGHVPSNMEFAATALTEHVEKVVAKAKTELEAYAAHSGSQLAAGDLPVLGELPPGEAG